MKFFFSLFMCLTLCLTVVVANPDIKGEIVSQKLNKSGDGYTVIRLWGTHYEMGYAQGALLHKDIRLIVREAIRVLGPSRYSLIRRKIQQTSFGDSTVEDEIRGIVDAMNQKGGKKVTIGDIKLINTYGDWGASPPMCRSHSCWGSQVADSLLLLSSRRLDYHTPAILPKLNHVITIREPKKGPKWMNFAFPGYVTVVTAINNSGTMVALHDYSTQGYAAQSDSVITRCALARWLITAHDTLSLESIQSRFRTYKVWTGTFLNLFKPGGKGGVFTANQRYGLYKVRTPDSGFLKGEVLITTNNESDGKSCPYGAEYLLPYYKVPQKKTLSSHWQILMDNLPDKDDFPLHQVSMEVTHKKQIRVLFQGRDSAYDTLPRINLTL